MRVALTSILMMLAALPATANAQEKKATIWTSGDGMATAQHSQISVPLKAGTLTNFALKDATGDGADMAAQYETPDGKILGTIFLYAPTRPDVGLTFLATDESIRRRFGATAQKVEDSLVPVGGAANAGRRVIYTGIADKNLSGDTDGRIYSAAAFVRAGAWVIKVRVSGPTSRSTEIGQNLDALLAGMKMGNQARPLPHTPIATTDCSVTPDRPLTKIIHPPSADALGLAIVLDADVQDEVGAIKNPLTAELSAMCREGVVIRDNVAVQTFRVTSSTSGQFQPRRVILYGDAGVMLLAFEDMKFPGEYYVSRHSIGRFFLFGRLSTLPSDAELNALLYNPEKQPAVIAVTKDHLKNAATMTVDCNLTAEGCAAEEKSSGKR